MRNLDKQINNFNIVPAATNMVYRKLGWMENQNKNGIHCTLLYVLDGGFVLSIKGQSFFVRKNQMALLPAEAEHSFWLMPNQGLTMFDFSFRAECNGEELFHYFGCNDSDFVVSLPEDEVTEIFNIIQTPVLSVPRDGLQNLSKCTALSKLAMLYLRERVSKELAKTTFADTFEYMRANIAEDLSLQMLADQMKYDATYFSAKFKKEVGISPMKYFAEMRAKEAAAFLRDTDMPIADVAAKIGFKNVYYFKSFFEKNMGLSPEKYREIFVLPKNF